MTGGMGDIWVLISCKMLVNFFDSTWWDVLQRPGC